MSLPSHGKIINLEDRRKRKWFVGIGGGLDFVLLDAYSREIDKLCCVKCSNKECRERDGSCWEYDE